jgi:hypothetical protein
MLGAAFAEAGALIAAADEPDAVRRELAPVLMGWIETLRANP